MDPDTVEAVTAIKRERDRNDQQDRALLEIQTQVSVLQERQAVIREDADRNRRSIAEIATQTASLLREQAMITAAGSPLAVAAKQAVESLGLRVTAIESTVRDAVLASEKLDQRIEAQLARLETRIDEWGVWRDQYAAKRSDLTLIYRLLFVVLLLIPSSIGAAYWLGSHMIR